VGSSYLPQFHPHLHSVHFHAQDFHSHHSPHRAYHVRTGGNLLRPTCVVLLRLRLGRAIFLLPLRHLHLCLLPLQVWWDHQLLWL
jgi:hypothetical protein